jgi:two-component system, cell cycle sensor histidine kinase and response regulator CckA
MSSLTELQLAAEQLPVAIWMGKVPTGEVVYINAEFRSVLGLDEPPDAGRGGFVEPYGVHKRDGAKYPENEMPFERVIAARATVVIDDLVIHRRDGRKVYLRVFAKPIFDEAGTMTHVLEAFTDITREVEAEAARADGERQLARAQRLESIGQLVAGIAHDFNNLLTVTKLVVSQLRQDEPQPARRALLADVDAVTDSAIALIRNLLGFAGRSRHVLCPTDVAAVVTSVVDLARRTFDRRVEVTTEIAAESTWIEGDRAQLEQVLMNLLVNARDALEGQSGHVTVRLSNRGAGEDRLLVLDVIDTGSGIASEIRDRIFEPYFTTKTVGPVKGTGLGLSTVHGIVKGHGGSIETTDNAPRGTVMRLTFSVTQPIVSPEAATGAAAPPRAIRPSATILVVDDERLVRQASRGSLEGLGFKVIEAEHGAHALDVMKKHGGELSAVVLDFVMPGMPSADVARKLRESRPDLPVLMVSGSIIDEEVRGQLKPHVRDWLPKPFGEKELEGALRRIGLIA